MMFLVGKNLGIRDEFNLCSGDLNECKQYCHDILVIKIIPNWLILKGSNDRITTGW